MVHIPKVHILKSTHTCEREICMLSKALSGIAEKCTPEEKNALEEVWSRMEAAETEIAWTAGKARDGEAITIDGHHYYSVKAINAALNVACDAVRQDMLENI